MHSDIVTRLTRNKGFTLAEVLITLTIIGVIAAMTIPTLISKVQDYGMRSAFLKNFNIIQNASLSAERNNEPFWRFSNKIIEQWWVSLEYQNDPYLFKKYFKIVKGPFLATNGGAWTVYSKFYPDNFKTSTDTGIKYLNKTPYNGWLDSSAIVFQLEDSTIIGFYYESYATRRIFIDVNGSKPPNTIGKDIFMLSAPQNQAGDIVIKPLGAPDTTYASTTDSAVAGDCAYNKKRFSCGYEYLKNKSYKIPAST